MSSRLTPPRVTSQHVWWALPILLGYAMLSLAPLREGDLWWHLKLGEAIATMRTLPTVDVWSIAGTGLPFDVTHSWLADLVLYTLTATGGLAALVMLQAILGTLTLTLVLWLIYRVNTAPRYAATLTLIGFLALYPFSTARPQVFSFTLFAVFTAVLFVSNTGRTRWLTALPPLMALWVNLHGGWVMGCLLLGVFDLGWMIQALTRRREWHSLRLPLLSTAATLLATGLNPSGFHVYNYLIRVGTSPVSQQFVSEWQPPSLTQTFTWPFWGLLALGLVLLYRRPKRVDVPTLAALSFTALALRYLRMIPFAVIALLPALADRLPQRPVVPVRVRAANYLLLGALLLFSALATPCVRLSLGAPTTAWIDPYFPMAACDVLAKRAPIGSGIFTMPEWGGYVAWRLAPEARPFVDGRIELPPISVWDEYRVIAAGRPGWEAGLRRWNLTYLLLSRERHERLATLAQEIGWRILYEDTETLLLEHP